jgi:hypothetical protein
MNGLGAEFVLRRLRLRKQNITIKLKLNGLLLPRPPNLRALVQTRWVLCWLRPDKQQYTISLQFAFCGPEGLPRGTPCDPNGVARASMLPFGPPWNDIEPRSPFWSSLGLILSLYLDVTRRPHGQQAILLPFCAPQNTADAAPSPHLSH